MTRISEFELTIKCGKTPFFADFKKNFEAQKDSLRGRCGFGFGS